MPIFNKLRKDKRGVAAIVLGLVIVLVMLAVILPISLYTVVKIKAAMPAFTVNSSEYNASKALYDNIFSAYNIASITPLIAVAGVIIGMIVVGFALRGRAG